MLIDWTPIGWRLFEDGTPLHGKGLTPAHVWTGSLELPAGGRVDLISADDHGWVSIPGLTVTDFLRDEAKGPFSPYREDAVAGHRLGGTEKGSKHWPL